MFACVAVLMVITGLPAWSVLIGVAGMFTLFGVGFDLISFSIYNAMPARLLGLLESDILQALPLYVFLGVLLNRLPLAQALFASGSRLLAPVGAARPLAGLGLGVLLSPMNGSVGASVAMLSRTLLPRLDAAGVAPARGAALVCVASVLGIVIPPSMVLILLGDAMMRAHSEALNVTQLAGRIINTQDIFRGALIPAAILVALCLAAAWITNHRDDHTRPERPRLAQWLTAGLAAAVVFGLLGSVVLGYLYAVEAAATGGVVLFIFGVLTRSLPRPVLAEVLRETMAISGALFALLVAANVFTLVLRAFATDRWIATRLAELGGGPQMALAAVVLTLLLCAFVLDAFEMIFAVIPILLPPLLMIIPDATWVAVITLLILQTSFILPPFGYAVMMIGHRLNNTVGTRALATALMPYVLVQLVVLTLVIAAPALLWRSPELTDASAATGANLSDEQVRELLDEQWRLQQEDAAPVERR
jgi:TRAP-type mannitol/chloroaromatic compound transport system permease large subunit